MPGPPVPVLVNPMDAFTFPCSDGDHLFVALAKINQLMLVIALEIPSGAVKVFTMGDLFELERKEPDGFAENGGNPADLLLLGMPGGVHQPGALHFASLGGEGPGPCGGGPPPPGPGDAFLIPASDYTISEQLDADCKVIGWRINGTYSTEANDIAESSNQAGASEDTNFPLEDDWILHSVVDASDPENPIDTGQVVVTVFVNGKPMADSSPPAKPPGTDSQIANKTPPISDIKPIGGGEEIDKVLGIFPVVGPIEYGEVFTVFGKLNKVITKEGVVTGDAEFVRDPDTNEFLVPHILPGTKLYGEMVDEYNAEKQKHAAGNGRGKFEIFLQPPPPPPGPGEPNVVIQVGILKFGPPP